jgi:hypothetical protein
MRLLLFSCLFLQVLYASSQDIGVQLYSFRNQFKNDIPGTLDAIKNMGITKLEGGDSYGLSHGEFKKMLDDRKMKVISVGGDFEKLQTDLLSIIGSVSGSRIKETISRSMMPGKLWKFSIPPARHSKKKG